MKAVADTLGVARSNLVEQLQRPDRPRRGPYARAEDDEVIAEIRAITDARPTYGYRRVTALLNRARRGAGRPRLNHKRVFRLMRIACLLLQPCTGRRAIRAHGLLYPGPQPREQRRVRGLREDVQARLCPREPAPGCHFCPPTPRRLVRRLQHHPPSQRIAFPLPA